MHCVRAYHLLVHHANTWMHLHRFSLVIGLIENTQHRIFHGIGKILHHISSNTRISDLFSTDERKRFKCLAAEGAAERFIQSMGASNSRRVFRPKEGHYGIGPRIALPEDVCYVIIG